MWREDNTDGLFVCQFIEATLRLTKGEGRGRRVMLRHWQGDLICDIYRRTRAGVRAYRNYDLWVARKAGKSLLGAGIALYGLVDEPGSEVYSAAGDKDQARLVFAEVKAAVDLDPELKAMGFKTYRDAIEFTPLGSVYRVVSSDAKLKEGLNPHLVIFDEKHVQPNDELWNVLNQGSGTRRQPLVLSITTKGVLTDSRGEPTLAKQHYDHLQKVMSGEVADPTWGSRIYETTLPPGASHLDEAYWPQGNPGLGDYTSIEDMRSKATKVTEADFKTKRLNIWVAGKLTWLPAGAFEDLADPRRPAIPGETAVLALDGSFDEDSTGLVAWLLGGDKPHLVKLGLWEKPEGDATGWTVPIAEVEAAIEAACRGRLIDPDAGPEGEREPPVWKVRAVAFDLARWTRTAAVLQDRGLPVEAFPQSAERMVPATQTFFEATTNRLYSHDGDPALARHFGNCTTRLTFRGRMLEKKAKATKIDLAVPAVFGYKVATETVKDVPPATAPSPAPSEAQAKHDVFRPRSRLSI